MIERGLCWLFCALLGCCLVGSCTKTIYVPAKSSTVIIDTVVKQVADSAVVRALFECDSNNRVVLRELYEARGEQASGSVEVDSSGSIEVVTRWRTEYIDRIKEVRDTTTVVEIREIERVVKHVPRFFWYCFGFSALVVVGLGVKLYMYIKLV